MKKILVFIFMFLFGLNFVSAKDNNSDMIKISPKYADTKTFYDNILVDGISTSGYSNNQMMQNFDIDFNNHYLYISYTYSIHPEIKKYRSSSMQVRIARIKLNSDYSLPSNYKNNMNLMVLNNSGHGQNFDVVGNNIWTDANGYIDRFYDEYYSHNHSYIRLKYANGKFNVGSNDGSVLTGAMINSLNSNGFVKDLKEYDKNPEVSVDEANHRIAIRNGSSIKVYKTDNNFYYKDSDLAHAFAIPSSINKDGYSNPLQGVSLYNDYLYTYYGASGGYGYIVVYNMYGASMINYGGYRKVMFINLPSSREAEGIKVINGSVYIGVRYSGYNGWTNKIYKVSQKQY